MARSLSKDVRTVLDHEAGASLIPAAFLAFAILDAIPTPTDVGYFRTQAWLDAHRHEISPDRFAVYEAINYYGWDVVWYLTLFAITWYGGGDAWRKIRVGVFTLSLGAVVAILAKRSHPEWGDRRQTTVSPLSVVAWVRARLAGRPGIRSVEVVGSDVLVRAADPRSTEDLPASLNSVRIRVVPVHL